MGTTLLLVASLLTAGPWADLPEGGLDFKTFFVTWTHNGSPEMFAYLEQARPEVVQIGFYGPMFHGYAHHPKSTGYPMQLPVHGEREALQRQAEINRRVHELLPDSRVIGHFQLCNVVENPDEPFGFIHWYEKLWDETLLGPRPTPDVRQLLQRNADGSIIKGGGYIDFIGLCLSSPHTRALLKKMVDVAIDAGVDGLVSNYNYRWNCVCPWCQDGFREYLAARYDGATLRSRFGIERIKEHQFAEIPARIPGYPKEVTPLALAAMDWGTRQFKAAFDEIYLDHGRGRRPGFVVGTWNHLGHVGHTEERALLPVELWGRGENYFWYSGSHAGKSLADGVAGDAWLNLLWLREMAQGKPMMIGKYEQVRLRVALGESAALGGAGTGLYHPFKDPVGAEVMIRYLRFIRQHDALYRGTRPYAEVGLLLPRQDMLAGRPAPMDWFRKAGDWLAANQVLFDVVLDQRLTESRIAAHRVLVTGAGQSLTTEQAGLLDGFRSRGGRVLTISAEDLSALDVLAQDASLSQVHGPWTLRAAANDSDTSRILHLVNYNRTETDPKKVRGPAGEQPIPQRDVSVALRTAAPAQRVTLRSPDQDQPVLLEFAQEGAHVRFVVPEVVAYCVVEIHTAALAAE